MNNWLKENWKTKELLVGVLFISLIINIILVADSLNPRFKKNAFCAEFKDQASDRIKTYYSDGKLDNVYPDEIFYSKKLNSCVAVWTGYQNNPAGNGITVTKVIFDAVTNKNIVSDNFFYFNDVSLNEPPESVLARQQYYDKTLEDLR